MNKLTLSDHQNAATPAWSDADFAQSRPASEGLPELLGALQAREMLKPKRGRPKAEVCKEHVNLRLDAAVLEAFRASGPGWQTRVNAALADWLTEHSPVDLVR